MAGLRRRPRQEGMIQLVEYLSYNCPGGSMRMRLCTVVLGIALSLMLGAWSAHAYTFTPAPGSPYAPIGPVEPSPGGYLGGIAAGDFNGDGVSDLAVVNSTGVPPLSPGESVTVFLGARAGGMIEALGSPVSIFSGGEFSGAGAIVAADFNGDGHLDLAVIDEVHHKVAILLGDGAGRFELAGAPVSYAGGGGATLVTGDFNGDGKQDIAVVDEYVTILLGNGSGDFKAAPGSPLALSTFGLAAAAGAFNSDRRSDLAVGELSGDMRVFLASASGELQPAPGSPIALGAVPQRMVAADLTGQGPLDLATANLPPIPFRYCSAIAKANSCPPRDRRSPSPTATKTRERWVWRNRSESVTLPVSASLIWLSRTSTARVTMWPCWKATGAEVSPTRPARRFQPMATRARSWWVTSTAMAPPT
jgi:FG-GAP-like repeat